MAETTTKKKTKKKSSSRSKANKSTSTPKSTGPSAEGVGTSPMPSSLEKTTSSTLAAKSPDTESVSQADSYRDAGSGERVHSIFESYMQASFSRQQMTQRVMTVFYPGDKLASGQCLLTPTYEGWSIVRGSLSRVETNGGLLVTAILEKPYDGAAPSGS